MRRLPSKSLIVPIAAKADDVVISEDVPTSCQTHNFVRNEPTRVFDFNEVETGLTWVDETDEGIDFSSIGIGLTGSQINVNALPQIPIVFAVISCTHRRAWSASCEEDKRQVTFNVHVRCCSKSLFRAAVF